MWRVVLLLLVILAGCDRFRERFGDIEIEDTYPISKEQQLMARQGNFKSFTFEGNIPLPNFSQKKEEAKPESKEEEKIVKKKDTCDVFSVSLDVISEKYPIKNVDSDRKIIVTEEFDFENKKAQITLFAVDINSLKVNSSSVNLAKDIKEEIILRCNH